MKKCLHIQKHEQVKQYQSKIVPLYLLWSGAGDPCSGMDKGVRALTRLWLGSWEKLQGSHRVQEVHTLSNDRREKMKMKAETLGLDSSEGNRNWHSILSFRYRWKQTLTINTFYILLLLALTFLFHSVKSWFESCKTSIVTTPIIKH